MTISKKDHILDVAESLFNEFGYTATGVDLIRDRANVSKTSMYRHFGSKAKLIESVLSRRHQRFKSELEKASDQHSDAAAKLDAILNWHFDWFRGDNYNGCMFMHALSEFKNHEDELTKQAIQHKVWVKSLIFSIFDEPTAADEEKSETIMGLLEGMIVRAEFGVIAPYEQVYRTCAHSLAFSFCPLKI
ncbi:TetR/AcrR family transcriptional regulator [Vibrio profundum]